VNLSDCERLLIVKPSSLGDIVHTLPAAEALHRAAPLAKIDWLVNTEWSPLLEGVPFLHRLVTFPRRELRGVAGLWRARAWAARELRPENYDLVVDFQGLFRSAYLSRRTGAPVIAGFERSREGARYFYDRRVAVPDWDRCHAVDRNLDLAAALGAPVGEPVFSLPAGSAPASLPPLAGSPVLLHPFSRGEGKSLSPAETLELCERLAPHPVLLVGIPDKPVSIAWPAHVVDLLGKTSLAELIHLLRLAAWTISVDSGPMHLAAGVSDRVLSIHTWSNPAMVGPRRPGAWIWRDDRLVRVADLAVDEFPERRDLAKSFATAERLLGPGAPASIAGFVHERLALSSDA
jgi:ADP-heptose:LPS heptosyltransferase